MNKLYSIISILIFLCFQITELSYSQITDQEEVARKSLLELKNKLESFIRYKEDELLISIKNNFSYSSELAGLVSKYEKEFEKNNAIISEKINQRNQIDLSERYIKVSGIVESVESGFSMINSGGERFSIKGNFNYNKTISGYVKSIGGVTNFKILGGGNYTLPNYELVKGPTPQEKYESLSQEIKNIKEQSRKSYETFISQCLNLVNGDIQILEKSLLTNHYESGLKFLKEKSFKSALTDFELVLNINNNYKDIQNLYTEAKNNFLYDEASKLLDQGEFNKSSNIYFSLSYPLEFKDSKKLFIQTFGNYLDIMKAEAIKKKDINIFLALNDTIESKIEYSKDEYLLNGIMEKYRKDFNNFALEYYSPELNVSNYTIVPGGYYLAKNVGTKVNVPGFLLSKNPFDYQLLKSYEITHNAKLNFAYNKSSAFDKLFIPFDIFKTIAEWIGVDALSENDLTYLECDGWNSIKEKEMFTNTSKSQASKNPYQNPKKVNEINSYNNHYKLLIENLKSIELKDKIESESSDIITRKKNEIQQIKEAAYNSGEIVAPKRLFLVPKAGISASSLSWNAPAPLSTLYPDTRVQAGFLGYQFNLLFGINFDDNKFIGTEIYHGLGINFSYFFSNKPTSNDVSFSNNPHEIEMFYNSLKMTEFNVELRYSNGYFIGVGYSSINFSMTYQALGQQLLNVTENKKDGAFSISIGMDGGWYELYIKSIIGTGKEGPYSWDSKNLSGNVQFGLKLGFPIRLIREEPVFY